MRVCVVCVSCVCARTCARVCAQVQTPNFARSVVSGLLIHTHHIRIRRAFQQHSNNSVITTRRGIQERRPPNSSLHVRICLATQQHPHYVVPLVIRGAMQCCFAVHALDTLCVCVCVCVRARAWAGGPAGGRAGGRAGVCEGERETTAYYRSMLKEGDSPDSMGCAIEWARCARSCRRTCRPR